MVRDVVIDVAVEMHARRARTVLMMAAVALSTGALLSAIGMSDIAAHQLDADLAASTVTLVSVVPGHGVQAGPDDTVFPADAEERATAVDLVRAAGRRVDVHDALTSGVRRTGGTTPEADVRVVGLTGGYLDAAGSSTTSGWMLDHARPAALLGVEAARALGVPVTVDPTGYLVHIDGRSYPVVGFLPSGGEPDLSRLVAIPYSSALEIAGGDAESQLLVRTAPGAGTVVADVIRLALRPDAPEQLTSSQVVDVADLRTGVSTQMDRLVAGVGGLLLTLTILLIGNAMVVSVMSRTSEIGLRRAIGASRGRVAALFWVEGALGGGVGGLAGSALAAVAVLTVAVANQWTATLHLGWVGLGPVLGVAAGLVSSLYPALRAAGIQPAQAVRAD